MERKAPLVMMFRGPHWVLPNHDTGWIDMPENPVNKYSLHKPRIFKVSWPGMHEVWQAAARLLGNVTIDNHSLEVLGESIDNDEDVGQPMVEDAMMGS